MTVFGIISDDLTGGMDTGVQFSRHGLRTVLSLDLKTVLNQNIEAIVMDTDSRQGSPGESFQKVYQAGKKIEALCHNGDENVLVYKKIDSTLRGFPGSELNAAVQALSIKKALVAPAFPAMGRVTKHGRVYVNGVPLGKSEFGNGTNAAETDDLCKILGKDSQMEVALIRGDISSMSVEELLEEIFKTNATIAVIDAWQENHLALICKAAAQMSPFPLLCGSAGLARGLPTGFALEKKELDPIDEIAPKAVLVVVGSRHPNTIQQIEYILKERNCSLLPLSHHSDGWIVHSAVQELTAGRDVVLTSVFEKYQGQQEAGIANRLGDLVGATLAEIGEIGLVLTGGQTARAVCTAAEIVSIELRDEVSPGIPRGVVSGGMQAGLKLVTKAGGFGGLSSLQRCIEQLRG